MTNIVKKIEINEHADGVCCNGGCDILGHPKVWYGFEDKNHIECNYCNRIFVKKFAN